MKIFNYDIKISNTKKSEIELLRSERKELLERMDSIVFKAENAFLMQKETTDYTDGGLGKLKDINDVYQTYYRRWSASEFRNALMWADRPDSLVPNWYTLFQIYNNMMLDTHINGIYKTLYEYIASQRYSVMVGEEVDVEATDFIGKEWFIDFCKYSVFACLYGFNLIQIDSYDRYNRDLRISQVNPFFVRPDLNGVVYNPYDFKVTEFKGKPALWTENPLKSFTCFMYFSRKGDLSTCFKSYIQKQNALSSWSAYLERFGIPPTIIKTASGDQDAIQKIKEAMKTYIQYLTLIVPKSVDIEIETMNVANNSQMFMDMIDVSNKEISKCLLGSTMVLEDGSSLSQSEVHENNTDRIIRGIRNKMLSFLNGDFLEKLRNVGCPIPQGAMVVEEKVNDLTQEVKGQAILSVLSNPRFTLSEDEIQRLTGIKIEGIEHENKESEQNDFTKIIESKNIK